MIEKTQNSFHKLRPPFNAVGKELKQKSNIYVWKITENNNKHNKYTYYIIGVFCIYQFSILQKCK